MNDVKFGDEGQGAALGAPILESFGLPRDAGLSGAFSRAARGCRSNAAKLAELAHGPQLDATARRHLATHSLFLNAVSAVPQTAADITRPPKALKSRQ